MLAVMNQVEQVAGFWFASPSCEIIASDFTTRVDIRTFADGHIRRWCYEGHRWFPWVTSWNPVSYRDVVCRVAELDRDGTLEVE